VKYPRAVDRVPSSAMIESRDEHVDPLVRPIRFPLAIRWYLLTTYRPWKTWPDVWRNLRFLLCG